MLHLPLEDHRSHRFEGEKVPYIFQYAHRHLSDQTISPCLRFLMHGMVFQTSTGEPVILKAHLLRHAFATFAVHVEGLPLDLVAEWLKQKNLDTTRYYSQKGQQDVAEEHASFVERLAAEINIRKAIVRSPEENQKLAESARRRVGTLIGVCGGDCTFDGWCHNQFDCIRCPQRHQTPEKRSHVEEKLRNAEDRLTYYEREGLVLEAEKMRYLIRNCHLELREMDLMAEYRRAKAVPHRSHSTREPPENEPHPWLEEKVYAKPRQRTVDLVKQSIDALRKDKQRVSLATVAARSKELDPEHRGVSESAILDNQEARVYYEEHRNWRGSPRKRAKPLVVATLASPGAISLRQD